MRNMVIKGLLLFGCWLLIVFFFSNTQQEEKKVEEKTIKKEQVEKEVLVEVNHNNVVKQIELEDYLQGVVACEMPYTFELEALKAQCIAARTFVLQRGLKVDDTTRSQVYKSKEELIEIHQDNYDEMKKKINHALQETKGLVMKYNGEYISALFYSSNNGQSNDASWYYNNEVPYLKSVDSPWDQTFEQTNTVIVKELNECMHALGVSSFTIGNIEKYDNGYIKRITIGGKVFTGREVREKLQLRSSCFSFAIQNNEVYITTSGFGHGVGMSQYGAQGMALKGSSFKEILKHYYTGVEITSIK